MTNQNLLQDMTTQATALSTKHEGWAAARSGKEAWIINGGDTNDEKWFSYAYYENLKQLHHARSNYCEKIRKGNKTCF